MRREGKRGGGKKGLVFDESYELNVFCEVISSLTAREGGEWEEQN